MEKKKVNYVNTKAEMVENIENILDSMRGKRVCVNVGSTISLIKTLTNFDYFWDSNDKRVLVLEDRNDAYEQDIYINIGRLRYQYSDFFNVSDNLNCDFRDGSWIQIYVE
jgi:hypothetical protein